MLNCIIGFKLLPLNRLELVRLELPYRDPILEHKIELFVSSASSLREPEPTPDRGDYADTTKEEPGLPSPVGRRRVQHVRNSYSHDDLEDRPCRSGKSAGMRPETS